MRIEISTNARKQMEAIFAFYNEFPDKIDDIIRKINRGLDTLQIFPFAGKIEHITLESNETYRSLVIDKYYKIIYRSSENMIFVISIFDCRQHPSKKLDTIN